MGSVSPAVHWAALQEHNSLRTLILTSRINMKPGDSLSSFPTLRVLYIWRADFDTLVDSVCELKHLRYLHLEETDVSRLPDDIDKMKFLRYIALLRCDKLCHLPNNIVKLVHLRSLDLRGSKVSAVPRGFGGLTSLRALYGFPVHADMDGGWCSLEELAPVSQLRDLILDALDNVPASLMAQAAMISNKGHLSYLTLNYKTSGQATGLGSEVELQQNQSVIEEVMEEMRPASCLENLNVKGYIGRQLPSWMHASEFVAFKSIRYLAMHDLPYCTKLPDGFCCLPCLETLTITNAPAIKRIGPEFQALFPLAAGGFAATSAPFPKLRLLHLVGLREWEEWEWNDCEQKDVKAIEFRKDTHQGHSVGYNSVIITNLKETFSSLTSMYSGSSSSSSSRIVLGSHDPDDCTQAPLPFSVAMPSLETLFIKDCKLSCLPLGLANKRHVLRVLNLYRISNLTCVDNFPSVVDIDVFDCPGLKRISGLSRLLAVRVVRCPNVEVFEGVPALDSLVLADITMETLPGYLAHVKPRYLRLRCSKKLYDSIISGNSSECDQISHIETLECSSPGN
ncbi:unnamed protein product [Urochloa humidicola]